MLYCFNRKYKFNMEILMFVILKKIYNNGLIWFYNRLILEFRIPQTSLGKKLKFLNILIYKFLFKLNKKNNLLLSKDTLYFFYDLEISPITYNFCEALAVANVHRIHKGLQYLYVVIVPGPLGGLKEEEKNYDLICHKDLRVWKKYNILLPMINLIPSCGGLINCLSREEAETIRKMTIPNIYPKEYSTIFPIAALFYKWAHTNNQELMPIRATTQAINYVRQWLKSKQYDRKIIVITLRQYNYMPKRNSNIVAWANFAKSLPINEYFVVIIPDTEIAMNKPLPELIMFEHFTQGCWNIELRAAIYEIAYLNLGINNGPLALCYLNKYCRYIMFKIINHEVPQVTIDALKTQGYIPGKNPLFATKYQKWVWKSDTEKTIRNEFIKMCKILKSNNIN